MEELTFLGLRLKHVNNLLPCPLFSRLKFFMMLWTPVLFLTDHCQSAKSLRRKCLQCSTYVFRLSFCHVFMENYQHQHIRTHCPLVFYYLSINTSRNLATISSRWHFPWYAQNIAEKERTGLDRISNQWIHSTEKIIFLIQPQLK